MEKFDVIVIGAGSGLTFSSEASSMGMKVAIVEKGPMGGTCLNRGCIPSKIIIHSADVAEMIDRADLFGINSKGYTVDFKKIIEKASKEVDNDAENIEKGIKQDPNTTLFKTEGKFVDKKILQVGNKKITADKIFIAAGTRPRIPEVKGLDKVPYMTSKEALRLTKQPKSLTIIGGGFIAAELAHFYGALGTKITIVQRNRVLLPHVDSEVSEKFTDIYKKKFNVHLEYVPTEVKMKGNKFVTTIEKKTGGGKKVIESEQLLLAIGRVSNADILDVAKTGVKTTNRGYVEVNKYMETNVPGIWAIGDIVGKYLLKHSANEEADVAAFNAFNPEHKMPMDYNAMPNAVFSSPQVAAVGMTEDQIKEKKIDYVVGKYQYINSGMGTALQDTDGFVKVLIERESSKILGCFILGTDASTLIHEVLVAMKIDGTTRPLQKTIHIHPALSEVVQRAIFNIKW